LKFWWFASSIDQPHTLEGLVRFFEAIDGVPAIGRTDRMGQLGKSRGKAFVFHPIALALARHYDLALRACDAGDAKRKGKVERPFRDLKAGFMAEADLDPPADIGELNRRAVTWLDRYVHPVVHGTTKVAPAERFAIEAPLLGRLPAARFDTAVREPAGSRAGRSSSGTRSSTRRHPSWPASSSRFASRWPTASSSCAFWAGWWPSIAWPRRDLSPSGWPSTRPPPKRSCSAVVGSTP
jgi:hypothetical protein